jgi:protoheme IX farnesyltransferase
MSTSTIAVTRRAALLSRLGDYAELTRPRIAVMIVATAGVAFFAASEGAFSLGGLFAAMAGVLLVAGSASSMNQWLERKSDRLMDRTCQRPAAAGRVGGLEVHLFAGATLVIGEAWLAACVGGQAAFWAAATWALYVWAYTPLKSRTWFNTVVGAAAGAMPVFIGWSAAPGADIPLLAAPALALFGLVFLWQFPHFMAIAWLYRDEYSRAGLQMLPVTDPSGRRAGQLAIFAALLTATIGLAPLALRWQHVVETPLNVGEVVGWSLVVVLGAGQFACAVAFARSLSDRAARRLLHASLVYLPSMLIAFLCLS